MITAVLWLSRYSDHRGNYGDSETWVYRYCGPMITVVLRLPRYHGWFWRKYGKCGLMATAVQWLLQYYGYRVTVFGYCGNNVTEVLWLPRYYGYRVTMVTAVLWLRR